MFLFIFYSHTLKTILNRIQIHLMFLFIKRFCLLLIRILNSNTSHVSIYQVSRSVLACVREFKYISCFYLSVVEMYSLYLSRIQIHLMFLFIWITFLIFSKKSIFKYISCFYLSCIRTCIFDVT